MASVFIKGTGQCGHGSSEIVFTTMHAPPILTMPNVIPSTLMHPSWLDTIKLILHYIVLTRDNWRHHTSHLSFCILFVCLVILHPSLHTESSWIYSIPPPFFIMIPSFAYISPFLHPDPSYYLNIRISGSNKIKYIMLVFLGLLCYNLVLSILHLPWSKACSYITTWSFWAWSIINTLTSKAQSLNSYMITLGPINKQFCYSRPSQ